MALIAERPYNKHGNSVFIRDGLKVTTFLFVKRRMLYSLQFTYLVHSLYKPPPEPFRLLALGQTGQVGLGVGSWPSNRATEGSNPKGT